MTAILGSPSARSRVVVVSGVVTVTAMSWAYLLLLAARMRTMGSSVAMPMTSAWTRQDVALMSSMWVVMMVGMMLPSAVPMISAYSTTVRSGHATLRGSTPLFVAGYLAAWSVFAALATTAQWALHHAALIDPMGASRNRVLGGVILVGAGAYQFTNLKKACLKQCRTPLGFLLNEWRPGTRGAAVMGLRHGTMCIGCCWALMAMLFVLGVMNLWWIAVVAAIALLEKVVPSDALSRVLGVALTTWGVALVAGLGG